MRANKMPPPPHENAIVHQLRATRIARGICQQTLSAELGISKNQIGFYEQGKYLPNGETLLAWLAFLDFEIVSPPIPEILPEEPKHPRVARVDARLETIKAAIARGDTYKQIGMSLGVTRERIRQIVKRHGLEPARSSWAKAHARNVALKQTQAALRQDRLAQRRAMLAPLVERVRNGESVHSIAGQTTLTKLLRDECKRLGIKSQARTRWSDFSARRAIVEKGVALRHTWAVIAAEVSAAEGRFCSVSSVINWAVRGFLGIRKERGIGWTKQARVPRPSRAPKPPDFPLPSYEIPPMRTELVREVCSLKGKTSASKIAKHFGLASRNVVIGIWHRNKSLTSNGVTP